MKIKTFEITLGSKKPTVKEKEIKEIKLGTPHTRNSGRTYDASNRVLYNRFLAEVFDQNELLAYQKKALTNQEIQRRFLETCKHNYRIRYKFKTYKMTIGMFRKAYNQQKLFSSQPPPYLVSFQYNECGHIVVGGNHPNALMPFEECYQRCLEYKIADPRFVPYDYIVELRNRQNEQLMDASSVDKDGYNWLEWIVPTDDLIKRLCTKLKVKELYNSVKFQIGFTREDTPFETD